jgi:putative ABC transport system substrate-binding protein
MSASRGKPEVIARRSKRRKSGIAQQIGCRRDDPHRFHDRRRPDRGRTCRQFQPPGQQRYGNQVFNAEIVAKRLQLLHDLAPAATVIGFLIKSTNPTAAIQVENVQAAAEAIGLRIHVVAASDEHDFDKVFETLAGQKADALLVGTDAFFNNRREQLIRLAARYRLPTVYDWRESAVSGGLMSYGTSLTDARRNMGFYAGRILQGEKPSELPVMQPPSSRL